MENPGITMEDTLQLVEALSHKQLDYLHVSVMDFGLVLCATSKIPAARAQLIAAKVGHILPIIGVGGFHTPEDAEKVLTGYSDWLLWDANF